MLKQLVVALHHLIHVGKIGSAERLDKDGKPDTHREGAYTDGEIEFVWEKTCDTILRGQIRWRKIALQ